MEGPDYLRFVLALAFVLALMGVLAHLAKRLGWGNVGAGLRRPGGRFVRRLNVIEIRQIDARHKLALVKCDEREHLLLLGPSGQNVIDADIPPKKDAAA